MRLATASPGGSRKKACSSAALTAARCAIDRACREYEGTELSRVHVVRQGCGSCYLWPTAQCSAPDSSAPACGWASSAPACGRARPCNTYAHVRFRYLSYLQVVRAIMQHPDRVCRAWRYGQRRRVRCPGATSGQRSGCTRRSCAASPLRWGSDLVSGLGPSFPLVAQVSDCTASPLRWGPPCVNFVFGSLAPHGIWKHLVTTARMQNGEGGQPDPGCKSGSHSGDQIIERQAVNPNQMMLACCGCSWRDRRRPCSGCGPRRTR